VLLEVLRFAGFRGAEVRLEVLRFAGFRGAEVRRRTPEPVNLRTGEPQN
jgi:hypothetical protein